VLDDSLERRHEVAAPDDQRVHARGEQAAVDAALHPIELLRPDLEHRRASHPRRSRSSPADPITEYRHAPCSPAADR
jgi:hypothetical protein